MCIEDGEMQPGPFRLALYTGSQPSSHDAKRLRQALTEISAVEEIEEANDVAWFLFDFYRSP